MTLQSFTKIGKTDTDTFIKFHQSDEVWTVSPGINVVVTADLGARADFDFNKLVNYGHILATSDEGVFLTHAHDSLVNGVNASIIGYAEGVELGGDQDVVINHGLIDGLYNAGIATLSLGATGNAKIVNTGEITGEDFGITEASHNGSMIVNKAGLIHGGQWGI